MKTIKLTNIEEERRDYYSKEFETIYEKYKNLVYYIVIRIIGIPVIAEEITDDAFLILFKHMDVIKNKSKIKTYLTTSAKRLAYRHIEKYNKEREMIDTNYDIQDISDRSQIKYGETWREVISKFRGYLTEEEIDLMIKIIYFEYSVPEIAKESNEKLFTVASRVRRMKIKLRKYYEKKGNERYE